MISLRTALTATMRMIDRIHCDTAHVRPDTSPAGTARLTDRDIFVVDIADLPDRRAAFRLHHPLLTRGQLQQSELALFRHQLRLRAGSSSQLRTSPRLHLNRMHEGAERDILDSQCVARLDIGLGAAFDAIANFQPDRS
jgi:hypothetical protein